MALMLCFDSVSSLRTSVCITRRSWQSRETNAPITRRHSQSCDICRIFSYQWKLRLVQILNRNYTRIIVTCRITATVGRLVDCSRPIGLFYLCRVGLSINPYMHSYNNSRLGNFRPAMPSLTDSYSPGTCGLYRPRLRANYTRLDQHIQSAACLYWIMTSSFERCAVADTGFLKGGGGGWLCWTAGYKRSQSDCARP